MCDRSCMRNHCPCLGVISFDRFIHDLIFAWCQMSSLSFQPQSLCTTLPRQKIVVIHQFLRARIARSILCVGGLAPMLSLTPLVARAATRVGHLSGLPGSVRQARNDSSSCNCDINQKWLCCKHTKSLAFPIMMQFHPRKLHGETSPALKLSRRRHSGIGAVGCDAALSSD